ncbi:MAG: hypothetical protein O3A60_09040, partial [Planctomycetota bacterium]|nr:hypothetical protein [Planctomycetota bacterium]
MPLRFVIRGFARRTGFLGSIAAAAVLLISTAAAAADEPSGADAAANGREKPAAATGDKAAESAPATPAAPSNG